MDLTAEEILRRGRKIAETTVSSTPFDIEFLSKESRTKTTHYQVDLKGKVYDIYVTDVYAISLERIVSFINSGK